MDHISLYDDVFPSIRIVFTALLRQKDVLEELEQTCVPHLLLDKWPLPSDLSCCSKICVIIIFLLWLLRNIRQRWEKWLISLNSHNISSLLSRDTFLSPSLRNHLYFPAGDVWGWGGKQNSPFPSPPPLLLCILYCVWQEADRAMFFFFFNKAPPWGLHLCTHCLDCAPFIGASVAAIYTSSVTLRRNFPYVRCVISPSSVRREERTELLSFTQTRAYRM